MPPPRKVDREILQRIPSLQLVQEIKAILASRQCAAIDFTLGGIGISPGGYRLVSDALMHYQPGIKHEQLSGEDLQKYNVKIQVLSVSAQLTLVGNTLAAVAGEYDPDSNILQFPFPTAVGDPERAGTIVHECTHAALDMSPKPTNKLDNEAVARIAKAAYLILTAKAEGRSYRSADGMDTVFQRAAEVMLAFNGCYLFPQAHRKIMHEVLQANGYSFGENDLGSFAGWGPGRTMFMPVTVVKRP